MSILMAFIAFIISIVNVFSFYVFMFIIMVFLLKQSHYWLSSQRNRLVILLTLKFQVECSHMADMAKEIVEANGFSNGEVIIVHILLYLIHLVWPNLLSMPSLPTDNVYLFIQ